MEVQIILLHYLTYADGARPAGEWTPFRQLPGGQAYDGAFQWRANKRLPAQAFAERPLDVIEAARALGGTPLDYGDVSFSFDTLPRLAMAVVLHRSDDEFPATANVLFDAAASHCLPTEDLAVTGELLVARLTGARYLQDFSEPTRRWFERAFGARRRRPSRRVGRRSSGANTR